MPLEALRWLAQRRAATAELLRLRDAPPVRCGASRQTARRSALAGWAGYGHDAAHHRFSRGADLPLCCPDGTVTGFGPVNPELVKEREGVPGMPAEPKNRPPEATRDACAKGFAGAAFGQARAALGIWVVRPPAKTSRIRGSSPPGCGSGWSRGSGRSKAGWVWTTTADASGAGCGLAWSSGRWR